MSIKRTRKASLLFALSAVGPLSTWYVLLFVAIPERQKPLEYALSMASYVLTEQESQWFFVLLVLTPLLCLALSCIYWRHTPVGSASTKWLKSLGVVATVLSAVVCWPAAIFSAQATYYAFRSDGG